MIWNHVWDRIEALVSFTRPLETCKYQIINVSPGKSIGSWFKLPMQHSLHHFLRMNLMYHMPFVLSALGPLKPDETSFMLLGPMKSLKSHVWSCIELMVVPASAGTSWNQTHEKLPWYSSSFALETWWDMPALVNLSCLCFCAPQQLVFYRFLISLRIAWFQNPQGSRLDGNPRSKTVPLGGSGFRLRMTRRSNIHPSIYNVVPPSCVRWFKKKPLTIY